MPGKPSSDNLNVFPAASDAAWRAEVSKALKGGGVESLRSTTDDGLIIEPLYHGTDDPPLQVAARPWTISARVDHPNPKASAAQALDDLENGATGLTLVFPGSQAARGFGIATSNVASAVATLDRALAGVELDLIALRLDTKSSGRARTQSVADLVGSRRLDPAKMQIDFGLDPISILALNGTMFAPWPDMANALAAHATALAEHGFAGPFFVADGRPWHEAGATEAQEVGAVLSAALTYVRLLEQAGWSLQRSFAAISFVLPVDTDQLVSTAKLRALRQLWAGMRAASGLAPEPIALHAETSWRMLSKIDPQMNILRNGIAAFAAATAGVTSLTVLPHSSSHGLPETTARRLARSTQLLMAEEASLWRFADPAAGSGALEALTASLAEAAWTLFQRFEISSSSPVTGGEGQLPGLIADLLNGSFPREIAAAAHARQQGYAGKQRLLVGATVYQDAAGRAPVAVELVEPQPMPVTASPVVMPPLPSLRTSAPFEEAANAPA